jgi:hypothetical protein
MSFTQGFFKPKNPQKYKGDPTQIVYRSSWELKVLINLDNDDSVVQYSSEEVVIPYICKTDGRMHRYFIDFYVKRKYPDGTIKEFLIEIKPFNQTIPPKKPAKITKSYINQVRTYAKNISKWEAAQAYCDKRGWIFETLTEKELKI